MQGCIFFQIHTPGRTGTTDRTVLIRVGHAVAPNCANIIYSRICSQICAYMRICKGAWPTLVLWDSDKFGFHLLLFVLKKERRAIDVLQLKR